MIIQWNRRSTAEEQSIGISGTSLNYLERELAQEQTFIQVLASATRSHADIASTLLTITQSILIAFHKCTSSRVSDTI